MCQYIGMKLINGHLRYQRPWVAIECGKKYNVRAHMPRQGSGTERLQLCDADTDRRPALLLTQVAHGLQKMTLAGIGITTQNNHRNIIRPMTHGFKALGRRGVPVTVKVIETRLIA